MKKIIQRGFFVISIILVSASFQVYAGEKPIQLALFTPIQIFPETDSITGFRFNLLYGRNAAVTGLDLGLVNHSTGQFKGVQFGFVGISDSDFLGWQDNAVNIVSGQFEGLQVGLFNYAKRVRGVQFGGVNYAGSITGLQIGLVNIIRQGGFLPVCIIVNGSF